ncbi:hypothetical protein DPEC_G00349200 [Dallia pectoralis]|uniref:Uncharacterized protein n=1 Tax=Dallia pectoralis TaxID=75939 RepID=A0ACC2F1L2_DALPE|nr:hypothetical protein DPEC_G00349200 [Dallia pectoralis]
MCLPVQAGESQISQLPSSRSHLTNFLLSHSLPLRSASVAVTLRQIDSNRLRRLRVSACNMGQNLGKHEPHLESMPASSEPEGEKKARAAPVCEIMAESESQDEVFGPGEADADQNNGSSTTKAAAVTDSAGTEAPGGSWDQASTADADDDTGPRPHLVRLFSRDAPGREDNTFKDRPSESDELQTIHEHSGAGSECGSEDQDLD